MLARDTLQLRVPKVEAKNKNLYAIGKAESEINDEAADNEEELQAWCLLQESEHEQWQEPVDKKNCVLCNGCNRQVDVKTVVQHRWW